jgi:hypothetical protein
MTYDPDVIRLMDDDNRASLMDFRVTEFAAAATEAFQQSGWRRRRGALALSQPPQ